MNTIKQLFVFLLMTGFITMGQIAVAQKQIKEINKVFQINKGDVLEIENKFGDIDIIQWEKSEVSLTIKISENSKNDDVAGSIIDNINIEINKEGNTINAQTFLNNESGMGHGNSFAINYIVNVPKWANLNLVNKFGNINIDEIAGVVNIDLKHGNLRILSLSRGNLNPVNEINMAFSNGVIGNAGSIKLNLGFSKLEIEDVESIVSETKYSGINAVTCRSFKCESKYDNFKFEKIRSLEGNLQYSNLNISEFTGRFDVESSFTGVKITHVFPSFESIKIVNSRGAYKIGIDPDASFDLYGNSDNGEINVGEFNILEKKTEGNTKSIHASNGTEGTGKVINLTVEDGSVNLFKNIVR